MTSSHRYLAMFLVLSQVMQSLAFAGQSSSSSMELIQKITTQFDSAFTPEQFVDFGFPLLIEREKQLLRSQFKTIKSQVSLGYRGNHFVLNSGSDTVKIGIVKAAEGRFTLNGRNWQFDPFSSFETNLAIIEKVLNQRSPISSIFNFLIPDANAALPLVAIYWLGAAVVTAGCMVDIPKSSAGSGGMLCGMAGLLWPIIPVAYGAIKAGEIFNQVRPAGLKCPQENDGKFELIATDGSVITQTFDSENSSTITLTIPKKGWLKYTIDKDWKTTKAVETGFADENRNPHRIFDMASRQEAAMKDMKRYLALCASDAKTLEKARVEMRANASKAGQIRESDPATAGGNPSGGRPAK